MASNKNFWKKVENNPELLGIVEDKFSDEGRMIKELNDSLKPGGGRKRIKKYNN